MQEQLRSVWRVGCLAEMVGGVGVGGQQGMPEPQSDSDASGGGLWVADEVGPLEGQV